MSFLLLNNSGLSDVEIPVNYLESVIMAVADGKVREKRREEIEYTGLR